MIARGMRSGTRTIQELLDLARQLIEQSDDGSLSIRDLAHRAGISSKTVYQLAGSKNAILCLLLEEELAGFQQMVDERSRGNSVDDFFEAIRAASENSFRMPTYIRSLHASLFELGSKTVTKMDDFAEKFWERCIEEMRAEGALLVETNAAILGRHLNMIYIAVIRSNLMRHFDRQEFEAHVSYGFALACLGFATPAARPRFLKEVARCAALLDSARVCDVCSEQGIDDVRSRSVDLISGDEYP